MYPESSFKRQRRTEPTWRKYLKTTSSALLRCGRDFCLDTSIHGFNHIATPGRHWFERSLWLCVTAAAIWSAFSVSRGQLQRYFENPTVITLEKDFRTWTFSLPAVTTCDVDRVNPKKLPSAIASRWHVEPADPRYEYYARFVAAVANSHLFDLSGYQEFSDDRTLDVDLYELVVEVMPELQAKATWSIGGSPKWTAAMTEAGACYVINSLAIWDVALIKPSVNDTLQSPMACKYSSLSCNVILEIVTAADFYIHSPHDVLDITTPKSFAYATLNKQVELSVIETGCGPGVRALTPQRRGCRFADEPDAGKQVYGTNACRISCRSQRAIKLCGCKPFYYMYEEGPVCRPSGMWCLAKHSQELWANGGEKCNCPPPCLDAAYKELATKDEIWKKGPFASRGAVKYVVQPPRTRYTREIVFYFQDLVVSFGGAAGLFLGASFISFVEILYFLAERLLGLCVRRRQGNGRRVKEIQRVRTPPIMYETTRIQELNSILENEKRLGYY